MSTSVSHAAFSRSPETAQVHGGGPAGGELVHLGELGGCSREADLESFDLARPAVLLGFGDAVLEVAADAGQV